MQEIKPAAVYRVSWSATAPVEAIAALTPPGTPGKCWHLLGGATQRLLERASRMFASDGLLDVVEWTSAGEVADVLAAAIGLPGVIGCECNSDDATVELASARGRVAIRTIKGDVAHFAKVTCEGFEFERRNYVALLAYVSPMRALVVPMQVASMLAVGLTGPVHRSPIDAVETLDAASQRFYPELSAALDRRRAGSIFGAEETRQRKLGQALGREAVQLCADLHEFAALPNRKAVFGISEARQ